MTAKRPMCYFGCLAGPRNSAGQFTSVSLAVTISIPRPLLLPILFFFGRGIDAMLPPFPLSLPTAFPKLFTHTTRMGWSLHPGGSVMPATWRAAGEGLSQRRKTCPKPVAMTDKQPGLFHFISLVQQACIW